MKKYAQVVGNKVMGLFAVPDFTEPPEESGYVPFEFPDMAVPDDYMYTPETGVVLKLEVPYTLSTTQIVADGVDKTVLDDVPPGTLLTHLEDTYDLTEMVPIEFVTDVPGKHQLVLECDGYRKTEIEIEAVAP